MDWAQKFLAIFYLAAYNLTNMNGEPTPLIFEAVGRLDEREKDGIVIESGHRSCRLYPYEGALFVWYDSGGHGSFGGQITWHLKEARQLYDEIVDYLLLN